MGTNSPALGRVDGSSSLEGYIAVSAYYIDLPGRTDDGSAMWANVLDTAILAIGTSNIDSRHYSIAVILTIIRLGLNLEDGLATGGEIILTRLLGQPICSIFGQRRYRPSVSVVMLDVEAVRFGGFLEFLVVIVPVVAYVLNAMGKIVEVSHFVEHGRCHLADRAIDVLGGNIDLAVSLAVTLPDFIYAAPAIRAASAVRRYRDGRANHFSVVEMGIEKVEHGFGFGYDLGNGNHSWYLLESYVLCGRSLPF